MAKIHQLKTAETTHREPPKKIVRPCDYGLYLAITAAETQTGTVEAYNKLCDWAEKLKAKIDAGQGLQCHAMWVTDPQFIYPAGHAPKPKK